MVSSQYTRTLKNVFAKTYTTQKKTNGLHLKSRYLCHSHGKHLLYYSYLCTNDNQQFHRLVYIKYLKPYNYTDPFIDMVG